ncbi:MAG: DUF4338 domain-containing protein [Desulfatitalea sp.]|nr:DUF4338 domain-containing protein [Desulfatitalea sp.]
MRYLVYGDSHLSGTLNIAKRSPFESERYWASRYMQIKRGNILLGALGFASSAWRLTSRDRHINWTDEVRTANLKYVVNNVRFLILPWIHSKYLASRILGQIARQLPFDWEARYGYRPVLLETFVQTDRFKGTCYKAANWIKIGTTGGYSLSSVYKKDVPTKDIYIYPLRKNYREILSSRCSEPSNRIRTQG